MKLEGDTGITIFLCVFIMTIGGCVFGVSREGYKTEREKEKTEQMKIQAKIDSMKIVNNINYVK